MDTEINNPNSRVLEKEDNEVLINRCTGLFMKRLTSVHVVFSKTLVFCQVSEVQTLKNVVGKFFEITTQITNNYIYSGKQTIFYFL